MVRLYFLKCKFGNAVFTKYFLGLGYKKTVRRLTSAYDFPPSKQSKLVEMPKSCWLVRAADLLVACS